MILLRVRRIITIILLSFFHNDVISSDMLLKAQIGYRDIELKNESFKINAPHAYNIGLVYFITDGFALEGSIDMVWGKIEYINGAYQICSRNDGRLMFILNSSIQYHWNKSGQLKPYIGLGYSYHARTIFCSEQGKEILGIGGGGSVFGQVGFDIKLNEGFYLNLEFKHSMPTYSILNAIELGSKERYVLSSSQVLIGISFMI